MAGPLGHDGDDTGDLGTWNIMSGFGAADPYVPAPRDEAATPAPAGAAPAAVLPGGRRPAEHER